ncbi:MAG: ABC transporter permease [Lachnospiraceae bacterium]|nr:ABC transporter permease [Lachnospiraceae bacterium]
MLAIYKKELRAYFNSVIGWLFLAFFLAFLGIYIYLYNFMKGYTYIGYALSSINLIFCLLVPMVTMRILAEEKRQKTDQLLLTAPISIWKIVFGKYLALVTLIGIAMVLVSVYPLLFARFGVVNFAMSYASILGFFLVGCAYLAIGLFISCLSESQAFAAVMTFIVVLLTCLADGIANLIPATAKAAWITYSVLWALIAVWVWRALKNSTVAFVVFALGECALTALYLLNGTMLEGTVSKVLGALSIMSVYDVTVSGVLELRMPVYYLSIAFVFCFLTYQNIRKRRYS